MRCLSRSIVATVALVLAVQAPSLSDVAFAQSEKESQKGDKPQAPKPANMNKNGVSILVKSAILALDQANKSGNYSVLRDLGSPNFQANTAARLAEIFALHRQQQLDLAGILVLEPQLTLLPQIEPNGMLHMAGFFPSVPQQVTFDMLWEPVNREWRLFGIWVDLSNGSPTAPDAPIARPEVSTENPQPPVGNVGAANSGSSP